MQYRPFSTSPPVDPYIFMDTFPDVSILHSCHTLQELTNRVNTCQPVRSRYVLFCVCYLFLVGCLLLHRVAHAEWCLFSLLQLLDLEHLLHHQLLDVQHLPFLTAQDLIQISACHHHCQDDHSQRVCRHHSYLREYTHFLSYTRNIIRSHGRCWSIEVFMSRELPQRDRSLNFSFWYVWIDWCISSYTLKNQQIGLIKQENGSKG